MKFVSNDLSDLKQLWESLSVECKLEFARTYRHIADLMYVQFSIFALQALVHFWNPTLKCFAFSMFDLTPTVEEYQALVSMPSNIGSKVYTQDRRATAHRSLSKFLGDLHSADIKKQMKTKGGRNGISISYLINLTNAYKHEKKGLSLLAMCIYGSVIFPRAKGYVDEEIIKLFIGIERGINPIIPILAETFRLLSYCKTRGRGKFFSCAPMLFIWMSSHLKCPT